MKMKIGINLLLWDYFVKEEHYPLFKKLKAIGYDGVEIPLGGGDVAHYRMMHQAIADAGLECTCTMNGSAEQNIISSDAKIRQAGVDHIKWAIEASQALESQIVGGPFTCAPSVFTGEMPTGQERAWAVENIREACDFAKSANVKLCAEFINHFECYIANTVGQTKAIVDAVDHESIGIHYDTHHVHYEEKSIAEAITLGGDKIYHVHFSESHRGTPGTGLVNWKENVETLNKIGYNGWITVEAFSTKNPVLRNALSIWRDLFESEEQLANDGYRFVKNILSNTQSI